MKRAKHRKEKRKSKSKKIGLTLLLLIVLCLAAGGGMGKSWRERDLDALELARSEREMRKGGESGCPEKQNGSLPPLIIAPCAAKHAGGRGGADEAVGKG